MILQRFSAHNFRNHADIACDIDTHLTLIIAPNAAGKTNLLDALHFLSTGRGMHEERKEELILFGERDMYVEAACENDGHALLFRAGITRDENNNGSKMFFLDKVRKMLFHYAKETFPVVLFSPSFMNIIEGSPAKRRLFIDTTLSRIDLEYGKRLRNYENGLRKRNKIIESERDRAKLKDALAFWDSYVIDNGAYITQKREWFVGETMAQDIHMKHSFSMQYKPNRIDEKTLEDSFDVQYYQRRTLVGPQRDDFRIFMNKNDGESVDVHRYSSRGERRLALLWLIMHQLALYRAYLHHPPLLLLDDIMSELDGSNKELVQGIVHQYQTIITSAEELPKDLVNPGKIIRL